MKLQISYPHYSIQLPTKNRNSVFLSDLRLEMEFLQPRHVYMSAYLARTMDFPCSCAFIEIEFMYIASGSAGFELSKLKSAERERSLGFENYLFRRRGAKPNRRDTCEAEVGCFA